MGYQARDLDLVFFFLLDNNALLDAILGAPNFNINNFLIIKNNNNLAVLSNIR